MAEPGGRGPGRRCVLGALRRLGQRGGLVVGGRHHIGRDERLAGGGEVDQGIGDLAVGPTRVLAVGLAHAAASSALSWESTISAYVGQVSEQLVVGAAADQLAVVEHQDLVGVADGGHPLRDDDHAGAGGLGSQRGPQPGVGGHVQGGERVVEHVDLRPFDQRSGDGQPLSLAAGDVGPALGDGGVQLAVHRPHEVLGLGDPQRVPELVVGRVRLAVAEVGRHRAGEQERLLRHQADPAPQQLGLDLADVDPVDQDRSAGRVEQPRQQRDQGGLAGAGGADHRGGLARPGGEGDVAQHRRLRAGVGELGVRQLDDRGLRQRDDRVRPRSPPTSRCPAPRRSARRRRSTRGSSIIKKVAIITDIRIWIR